MAVVPRRPDDLVHLSDVPNYLRQRAGGIYEGFSESDVIRALQDGQLTAWDGDAPLTQDFWNGKEGRDLITGGYLVSRAEVLAIWPDIAADNVMPTHHSDKPTLLWDAAVDMSRTNGKEVERNWLAIMDAFWRGDIGRLVLVYKDGTQHLEREGLAWLLGLRNVSPTAIEHLTHWTVQQYQEHSLRGWYFNHDTQGRFGLAAPKAELDRWLADPGPNPLAVAAEADRQVCDRGTAQAPNPEGSAKRRRNETRPPIKEAIRALWGQGAGLEVPRLSVKALCIEVEKYLGWSRGMCSDRTFRRAMVDLGI